MNRMHLLSKFYRLKDFIEAKSPFHEPHMLDLEMQEDTYESYRIKWLKEKEFFKAETGHTYPTWNCLRDWADYHHDVLLELPRADQVELAVWAAGTFQDGLLDVFLDSDANFNLFRNAEGDLPLHAAAACQSILLFPRLMDSCPTALHKLNADGLTPIQVLILARDKGKQSRWPVRFGQGKHTDCLRSVAHHDERLLRLPFEDGNTPLHLAASLVQPMAVCKIIVGAGGLWNQPNRDGVTPAQVLEANIHFQPNPKSRNPERRREARFRESILVYGQKISEPSKVLEAPLNKGWLGFLRRR